MAVSPDSASNSALVIRTSVVAAKSRGDGPSATVERTRQPGLRVRRLQTAVDRVELVLDHPQRQVVVALGGQHVAEPLDVGGG